MTWAGFFETKNCIQRYTCQIILTLAQIGQSCLKTKSFFLLKDDAAQRFVSSIGNIEKAMWVFNCLGRLGWFGQSEIILQTDVNYTTKDPWQFSKWYSKNYPNQKKFGSFVFKPKKECWFYSMIKKTRGFES